MIVPRDMSEGTSACVESIVQILQSEFKVNPVVSRSAVRSIISIAVIGRQYCVGVDDDFEEKYDAMRYHVDFDSFATRA